MRPWKSCYISPVESTYWGRVGERWVSELLWAFGVVSVAKWSDDRPCLVDGVSNPSATKRHWAHAQIKVQMVSTPIFSDLKLGPTNSFLCAFLLIVPHCAWTNGISMNFSSLSTWNSLDFDKKFKWSELTIINWFTIDRQRFLLIIKIKLIKELNRRKPTQQLATVGMDIMLEFDCIALRYTRDMLKWKECLKW